MSFLRAHWRRILLFGGVGITVLAMVAHGAVSDPHLHDPGYRTYFWNEIPVLKDAWFGAMGFGGCWLIVVLSKLLGKVWLQRPEDYYDEGGGS